MLTTPFKIKTRKKVSFFPHLSGRWQREGVRSFGTGHCTVGEGCQAAGHVLEKSEGRESNRTSWETIRLEGLLLFLRNWSFWCLPCRLPYLLHVGSHEECSGCWCGRSARVAGGGSWAGAIVSAFLTSGCRAHFEELHTRGSPHGSYCRRITFLPSCLRASKGGRGLLYYHI